jgi:hypothetical protein
MLRGDVGRRVVYAMLGMFHVKQQVEYVWTDEVSGGGVMLPSWLGDGVMVGCYIRVVE